VPDLLVSFAGQTMRMPLPPEFTGHVQINLVQGQLGARGSKVGEAQHQCRQCGSRDIMESTVTRGFLEQPGLAGKLGVGKR
jgi:hypothetical protein